MQPVFKYMKKRLSFKSGFAATVITSFIILLVLFIICYLVIIVVKEIILFISNVYENNNTAGNTIMNYLDKIFKSIDLSQIDLLNSDSPLIKNSYDFVVGFVSSIPAIVTMIIVTVFSTFYFINSYDKIVNLFLNLFNEKRERVRTVCIKGKSILNKFFRAFLIIYFLTFLETLAVFLVLRIKYALFFSVLSMIADIIPVLGPGTVYIPLAVIYLLQGNYAVAFILIGAWILVSVVRQVVEPKVVSNTIQIHPLLMLSAIYFSLQLGSLWILIYLTALFLIYQVLVETNVLPPLSKTSGNK